MSLNEEIVDAFRKTLKPDRCWVLFANGTVVILPNPASKSRENLTEEAKTFIKENGPVVPGTPLGDFNVFENKEAAGFFVTSHSEQLLTFVPNSAVSEVAGGPQNNMMVGLYGRSLRDEDAKGCEVVHVEGEE